MINNGKHRPPPRAISLDLFGTLLIVERPPNPDEAIAKELAARDIPVPAAWTDQYGQPQGEHIPGQEIALTDHVLAILEGTNRTVSREPVQSAIRAACSPTVTTTPKAAETVAALGEHYPIGILTNCSVHGLAQEAIAASALERSHFDCLVSSVACGWRKPHPNAFHAIADELGVDGASLVHIGDDPQTDGGAQHVGARFIHYDGSLAKTIEGLEVS